MNVKRVLGKYRVTGEQPQAIGHLIQSPDCIRSLDSRALAEIWERHGYRVIGAACTGKAADELKDATEIPDEVPSKQPKQGG